MIIHARGRITMLVRPTLGAHPWMRSRRLETRIRSPRPQASDTKLPQSQTPRPETLKHPALTPKPHTPNPEPQTLNPKPQPLSPRSQPPTSKAQSPFQVKKMRREMDANDARLMQVAMASARGTTNTLKARFWLWLEPISGQKSSNL